MKKLSAYLSVLMLLLASVQFQGCKKEGSSDPQIQTVSVTALGPGSVLMKGNIVNTGSFKISDYGFVYSTTTSSINETTGLKVSLGSNPQKGPFSTQVNGIIVTNSYSPVLYVRAYITNEKGTAFGALTTITLPTPTASSVSPASGKSGDQITITGQFYSTPIGDIKVTFGGLLANVLSASSSQIVVTVPSGISASDNSQISVQVIIAGQALNPSYFTIQANFKDYSPKSGPIGTVINFTGDNLPNSYYSNFTIQFGSVTQTQTSYNNQGVISSGIKTNNFQISVTDNGKTFALPGTFNVTAPTISSLSPGSGLAGTQVTVSGTNFPADYNGITATLGNVSVVTSPYNSSQFYFTVPTGISPGTYSFAMTAGPNSVTATQKFTVTAPSVTSFSPSSGPLGGVVTLTGTFIAGSYYTVNFGSATTTGYASTSNSMTVNVPTGVPAGAVKVSVVIGNQTVTAPGSFTVTSPKITSFSPTSGVAGTIVTITGTGFNFPYGPLVSFGTVNATVTSITSTTITAIVPSNTGNGAMKILVTYAGQTVESPSDFTVTN